MKNYFVILFSFLTLLSCSSKKHDPDDNRPPEVKIFFKSYPKLRLPFYAIDSTINNKAKNNIISLSAFTKVIPDTIFNSTFSNNKNITLYPVGKIDAKTGETYFVTLAKREDLSAIFLSVYDSNKHTATIPLLTNTPDEAANTASLDKKLTVVINKEWTVKNVLYYNRTILAYNNVGVFTTVLTETNEQRRTSEAVVTNPLDTFPKRYKYSGDYAKGSKSVLFIRDSKVAGEYLFFIHFKNDNSEDPCTGEFRGKFKMKSETVGEYAGTGDPCVLDLTFKGNEVQVKENNACGNYRDIKCFFNDTYTKKKEPKAPTRKR